MELWGSDGQAAGALNQASKEKGDMNYSQTEWL